MFKRISILLVLLLALVGLIGCATTPKMVMEEFRIISIPEIGIRISLPESAPDFHKFSSHTLGSKMYPNGNGMLFLESLNKELTVDAVMVVVKKGSKISIVALQVTYCPAGFDHIDLNKPLENQFKTDNYEDVSFTNNGAISGILIRVNKMTDSNKYSKFLLGNEF
jgi:hypothetical protein